MGFEDIGYDLLKGVVNLISGKKRIQVDATKVTLIYHSETDRSTELVSVEFKLYLLNNSGKEIFVKFSDPKLWHAQNEYKLWNEQIQVSHSYVVAPKKVTELKFEFGIIGGYTVVKEFLVKTLEFEITYHINKKSEKIFVYNDKIERMSRIQSEPLVDEAINYYKKGEQLILEGKIAEAMEEFKKSELETALIGVYLSQNADAFFYNRKFDDSIKLYLAAKRYFEKAEIPIIDMAWGKLFANLANAYCYNSDYRNAIPYFDKAADILMQIPGSAEHLIKMQKNYEKCMKGKV